MEKVNDYKEIKNCKECQNSFMSWKCRKAKYCGVVCKGIAWSKLKLHRMRTPESFQKISKAIKGRKRPEISGDKCYKWKGGRSRGYKTGYYSLEYRMWRTNVFVRDNFTCQNCGIIGGYLTAHHVKSFAYYPELRFELGNGITLCEPCHSKTDNYKGRNKYIDKYEKAY